MSSRTRILPLALRWSDVAASTKVVPRAINIPVDELRPRLPELPRDRPIWVHCYVGQRSYVAVRMLVQHGFNAFNISGGYRMYEALRKEA